MRYVFAAKQALLDDDRVMESMKKENTRLGKQLRTENDTLRKELNKSTRCAFEYAERAGKRYVELCKRDAMIEELRETINLLRSGREAVESCAERHGLNGLIEKLEEELEKRSVERDEARANAELLKRDGFGGKDAELARLRNQVEELQAGLAAVVAERDELRTKVQNHVEIEDACKVFNNTERIYKDLESLYNKVRDERDALQKRFDDTEKKK